MSDSSEARKNLERLKTEVFESSNRHVAVALGRPVEEVDLWFAGGEIDEDAVKNKRHRAGTLGR
jgi:hypothetical protein